jgi:nucleoside diphosphate kinase
MAEHRVLVTKVFSILQKEGLAVVAHKSFFHIKEVESLGYIIHANGIEMFTRKVKAVHSWKMLRNLKDVLRFLRFVNLYHRFINFFSGVAYPITDLTCNKGLDLY